MREELSIEILNMIMPYVSQEDIQDIKLKLTMVLANYEVQQRCTELTVADEDKNTAILKKFIAAKIASGRTRKTLNYYKTSLEMFFNKIRKDYDEITADDVRLYLAVRVNQDKVSKTTANNERRNLSAFYNWLYVEELIRHNPMAKVEIIKEVKKKKKAFTDLELEKIRHACRTTRETAIIEILCSTWCRVTELSLMRIDEMDDNEILVHGKGEKDRITYLNAKAQMALARYMEDRKDTNPFIFPRARHAGSAVCFVSDRRGRKIAEMANWYTDPGEVDPEKHTDSGTIESIVRNIGKRAGVENVHPHRFRRTGATNALKSGMPLTTVSKLLGHANIGTTQIYLDISDDELEQAHIKYVR